MRTSESRTRRQSSTLRLMIVCTSSSWYVQVLRSHFAHPVHASNLSRQQGKSWGSGDPREYLPSLDHVFFDAHRYLSFDKRVPQNKQGYIDTACADYMGEDVVVGEWSLAVNSTIKDTPEFTIDGQETWYRSYWAAQAQSFEKSDGWLYWSWKCDGRGDDWRWCYSAAVDAGVIPQDASQAAALSPC
jgi:glucan endo-1,6-beta-glucosidase